MFIGDNEDVARVMGINVPKKKIQLFTINGLIAGFAAILLTLEMVNFWSTQGASILLPVMAAVFIGGTSIAGGEGLVLGTLFGAYIIGSLEAGVVAIGIGDYFTRIVTGLVMAGSVILNVFIKGKGEKIVNKILNVFAKSK
jgi:simple sugar transport system permease protein